MDSASLRHVLGFRTQATLRYAIANDSLSLSTFAMDGRRGRFALTIDVAAWLASRVHEPYPWNDCKQPMRKKRKKDAKSPPGS